jgi:hypothetical protein
VRMIKLTETREIFSQGVLDTGGQHVATRPVSYGPSAGRAGRLRWIMRAPLRPDAVNLSLNGNAVPCARQSNVRFCDLGESWAKLGFVAPLGPRQFRASAADDFPLVGAGGFHHR